ncbi:4-hydroxy-3-methylbut-2-enyl diphosphate reductase IspH [Gottschalkia purinilytica]|uniref:4-hydroxy-3-methylbut-2-enyl diphosphate reductase n=1 Tax=Gottschalkia purinilytica TaxID=1503 RepID=A0A0L0W7M5_GOTPU|nr:bifunctional 4-hydroxy-3-methylbut-2-enyl diphosphate reductase/30S ribosomal protein S1 [Gottschalkia purinilytica]KNF07447.1 4-hydroxy-3-methylbut-2-enyl diphosphate reductase IspH [Gottschalkia purinilytica]
MKIIIAENAGFCFGVKKAIESTINQFENKDKNIYSLGPLIHNKQVIDKLSKKGLNVIENISEADKGKVVIRSHGVPLSIYDEAKEKNIEVVDCTCPFVRNVQRKAHDCYKNGYDVVIIGDSNHPEVIGIKGWCDNKAYSVNSEDDVNKLPSLNKVCIVAQTTITNEKFETLSKLVSKKSNEVHINNTICNATNVRQSSCRDVAKQADAMIVIGGYHSSNTQKLVEISKKYCKNVYHIEVAEELPLEQLKNYQIIGITAGASTPAWIIEEVYNKMSNISNDINDMSQALNNTFTNIRKGDILEGEVILVGNDEVVVNIGYKSDGIIKKEELTNDQDVLPSQIVSIGDKISVLVINMNDGEGNVLLSKKRVDNKKNWEEVSKLYKNEAIINVKVKEVSDNGLIVNILGLRGFIPKSQVSNKYIKDFNSYLNKELDVKVIDLDKTKNRIVLSRKLIEQEEQENEKEKTWSHIKKGQIIKGKVKRITDFGAFVDIGGIDGLLHISDLSWTKVKHPSKVVNVGDEIEIIILDLDKAKERISLGLKQLQQHPWEKVKDKYTVGSIIDGTVVKLLNFGAFVELEPGIEGLVHITQITDENISKPSEILNVGDKVRIKILSIDEEQRRIELSIKEADLKQNEEYKKYNTDESFTIGDIINVKNLK